jgi:ribonuclease III
VSDANDVIDALVEKLALVVDLDEGGRALITRSLSHRSWCSENGSVPSNERLEFLGDSVLGLIVTDYVFENFPNLPEGQLSEVRAGVVNAEVLAEVAREIDLGHFLLLGKGEASAGGREKQSILSDALEAVIGAVYLVGGFEDARRLVLEWLEPRITLASRGPGGRDAKTRLQEVAAQRGFGRPHYTVEEEGPDHAKKFFASVMLDGVTRGSGEGSSKKQAEQAAAVNALGDLADRSVEGGGEDAGAA